MEKPTEKYPLEKMLNYNEVIKYIETKYSIDTRDYNSSHNHFPQWLNTTGEEKPDYNGDMKKVQEQYKRYQEYCKEHPEPKYLDFWHWIIDQNMDISNGSEISIPCPHKERPDWVNEILTLIYKEFYPDFYEDCKNGNFEQVDDIETMWVEW